MFEKLFDKISFRFIDNFLTYKKLSKLNVNNILIITGAGISKESGIETFRENGIYDKNPELIYKLRPDTFETDPEFLYNFHNDFKIKNENKKPTNAHLSIASHGIKVITQNIDNLHEKAGSSNVLHIHGDLASCRCEKCKKVFDYYFNFGDSCKNCGGRLRHNVVLFKEPVLKNREVESLLRDADFLIQIGSSGVVYPVAGYVDLFNQYSNFSKKSLCIDVKKPENRNSFDFFLKGRASSIVPRVLNTLMNRS